MKKQPPADEPTFEQAIARLEEIVAELDRGDLALEEALKLFQEGTALRGACERKLAEAEATVEQLLEGGAPAAEVNGEAALESRAPTAKVNDEAALESRAPTPEANDETALESRASAADSLFGDDDE